MQLSDKLDKRGVSETQENIIKGSLDSFVESFQTNLGLVKQHYNSEFLNVHTLTLGKKMLTTAAVLYNSDAVDHALVQRVIAHLNNYNKDYVTCAGDIEKHLSKHKNKLFPQLNSTQRPDKAAANLAKGKIIILIDNIPFCYIAPTSFTELMQASEDYSINETVAQFIRVVRYASFFISIAAPAIYVAIMLFSQEMIPRQLALAIIISKQGVPMPTPLEAIMMLLAFEILLEAGVRMPKTVGQAVSIVGALVVGQAAVSANFISPSAIVVVALSAICGFAVVNTDMASALRLWRIVLVVLATMCGFYGVILGLIVLVGQLSQIKFFGREYIL